VPVIRIRGTALPGGEFVDLYADGDRWTADPVPGAELVAEGWLLPGLVDAHTHPGADAPGKPLDDAVLRADLHEHVAAGVTLIRSPGLAGDPPGWFGEDDDVPRAVHAGPWIAQHGQFFDGWGRRADDAELPGLAAAQAGRTGWAKVIADWQPGDDVLPVDVLRQVVAAVHAAGGRLAVHSQHAEGGAAAVAAGVDSLEHGMGLDQGLLPQMARQGTALTPTLSVITGPLAEIAPAPRQPAQAVVPERSDRARPAHRRSRRSRRNRAGRHRLPALRPGDRRDQGPAEAGVPAHQAIGAASWAARSYLGLAGLGEGAPADAVIYDADPRADLSQLATPRAVILRGKIQHRRS
jgi:imidazolonepropionase-like amidohydrolase